MRIRTQCECRQVAISAQEREREREREREKARERLRIEAGTHKVMAVRSRMMQDLERLKAERELLRHYNQAVEQTTGLRV
eukprot:10620813-Prorocentrum_lima.AAC.1